MLPRAEAHLTDLIRRYPILDVRALVLKRFTETLIECQREGRTLFVCGNGGSAADADHIVAELMKKCAYQRPIPQEERERLRAAGLPYEMAVKLESGLRALWLGGSPALLTAILNDTDPTLIFAQPLYVLGRPGDCVLGISTSGNAVDVLHALRVGRALGLRTLALTGERPSRIDEVADVVVHAPVGETAVVQDLHRPIYHAVCLALEAEFFGGLPGEAALTAGRPPVAVSSS
jgi:D-sedoheptulose 7-phosphate isomerase